MSQNDCTILADGMKKTITTTLYERKNLQKRRVSSDVSSPMLDGSDEISLPSFLEHQFFEKGEFEERTNSIVHVW